MSSQYLFRTLYLLTSKCRGKGFFNHKFNAVVGEMSFGAKTFGRSKRDCDAYSINKNV